AHPGRLAFPTRPSSDLSCIACSLLSRSVNRLNRLAWSSVNHAFGDEAVASLQAVAYEPCVRQFTRNRNGANFRNVILVHNIEERSEEHTSELQTRENLA